MEAYLQVWIREQLHEHWVHGTDFLPHGIYEWQDYYAFRITVGVPPAGGTDKAAAVQYGDLSEALVWMQFESGVTLAYDKATDSFVDSEGRDPGSDGDCTSVFVSLFVPINEKHAD